MTRKTKFIEQMKKYGYNTDIKLPNESDMFQFNVNYVTSRTKKIFSGQKTENFLNSDDGMIGPRANILP